MTDGAVDALYRLHHLALWVRSPEGPHPGHVHEALVYKGAKRVDGPWAADEAADVEIRFSVGPSAPPLPADAEPVAVHEGGLQVSRSATGLNVRTMLLNGDQVRHGLAGDLRSSPADRRANVRRIGEVARLVFEAGAVTLCTFVSPYRTDRDRVRALIPGGRFFEVHVDVELETARDREGLYAMSDRGRSRTSRASRLPTSRRRRRNSPRRDGARRGGGRRGRPRRTRRDRRPRLLNGL